ncbi:hypothetical protein [Streptomyces sp. NPDC050564]|uniref:hypothetical protein n=1 Tax=Streptomyces sp. NPDC050564 TaxID=3365631 RepID=UPI00379BDC5B
MDGMEKSRRSLSALGLPEWDLGELPDSDKRFPDGTRERVRRAAIGLSVLRRHYPEATASPGPMRA